MRNSCTKQTSLWTISRTDVISIIFFLSKILCEEIRSRRANVKIFSFFQWINITISFTKSLIRLLSFSHMRYCMIMIRFINSQIWSITSHPIHFSSETFNRFWFMRLSTHVIRVWRKIILTSHPNIIHNQNGILQLIIVFLEISV